MLKLLATYSPELPCLLKGAARYAPILAKTFEGNQVKQYIEFGSAQYGAYTEDDLPEYGEVGHGPWCSGLPFPPVPIGPVEFDDGTDIDSNPPTGDLPVLPGLPRPRRPRAGPAAAASATACPAATPARRGSSRSSTRCSPTAPAAPADSYGSLGALLYGPVVRGGAEVAR